MKKIAVFVVNPIRSPYKHDQYDSFRAEGRNSLNMGFGLALLGFEVNIIMIEWEVDSNKQVYNNVYLSNVPKYNHYDYVLTWSVNTLDLVNFDKAIFMDWSMIYINDIHRYINRTNKNIVYTSPVKYLIRYGQRQGIDQPIETNYLPVLYPIPSINVGFVPYKFECTNLELKIYVYCAKNTEKYIPKQQLIINFLRDKGYKIKLYLHTNSKTCPFNVDSADYIVEMETRYIDIINAIMSSDMCICIGGAMSSPDMPDMIGLGKPIVFISDSFIDIEKDLFGNCIYEYPEFLLYMQESDEESIKKLEKFILNPKESYDKFKDAFKDIDFNNWKEYAKKYFVP